MMQLIKRLCIALIVLTVMQPPGLDTASHRGPTRKKHLRKGANKDKIKYYYVPSSGMEDRDGPGSSVHAYTALQPLGSHDTVDEIVNFLAGVYNFMEGITENYFPGSEFVDKFWRLLYYFINKKVPFIETFISPSTVWHNLLYLLLKKQEVIDVDPAENVDAAFDEQYTRIKFEPFKQLIIKFLYIFGEFFGFNFDVWWSKISQIFRDFSLFTEENLKAQDLQKEVEDMDIGSKLGLGAVLTPLSHLAVYKYDPVVFGVNVLLLIVWQLAFMELYAPSLRDFLFGDESEPGDGSGDGSGNGEEGADEEGEGGADEGGEEGMDDGDTEGDAPDMEDMEDEDGAPDPPSPDLEPPPEENEEDDTAPDDGDDAPDPPSEDLVPPPPLSEEGDAGDGEDVAPDPLSDDLVPPPPPAEEGDVSGDTENGSRKDYYYYYDDYYDHEYDNDADYYYYYYYKD